MTSARESFRDPPIILADGRLLFWPDGEYQAFYGPKNCSWTTGVLDSRDLSTLIQHLPVMADDALKLWEDVT